MSTEEPESYLAILKASYDYEPQSDDEIAIHEDQLLLLVEKVDDEWWKVKVKATSQETDSPVGLVPAAYVEQAEHTSVVKALYDYEAAAPGELSLHEDDVLLVFDTEEDWILVQNANVEGKAGYVPGNYVEVADEEPQAPSAPTSRIVIPDSPPRPVSTYVDPADRVASTKVTADDIQTWSVSEIDKKGKKKKGTLGIGNGAVFFASEADKTPVQKWQTKDVSAATSEKSKHVRIDVGGPNPISLHFHAGSKDAAESILAKVNSSKALSSSNESQHEEGSADASNPKKASVHFSASSPVIIPTHHEEEEVEVDEAEEEEEEEPPSSQTPYRPPVAHTPVSTASATALYDFIADGEDELSVTEGEKLIVLEKDGDEWWKCRNSKGQEGVVPASYVEETNDNAKGNRPEAEGVDRAAEERQARELAKQAEAERLQREQAEQKRKAAEARKLEAQQKAQQAALAAEADRLKRKEVSAAATRLSPPPAIKSPNRSQDTSRPSSGSGGSNSRASSELNRPSPDKTRVWHDRSGQFRVEAAFLGFNNGKLRLHKVNGVIVEVPSEKMSLDDMRHVERLLEKKPRIANVPRMSEDDIPLALSPSVNVRNNTANNAQKATPPPKKAPRIDWFDFFLSAGCDLDDCTRYAASFERDKIDETLLVDITEGTMRSLGLREGDIIRVKKAIEKRNPTDNLQKLSARMEEQMRRDEEMARELQALENAGAGSKTSAPPNLFAGPGGVLKPRRGRPQPNKSLPLSNVDIKAISSVSEHIQRTASPLTQSPVGGQTSPAPARPSSAAAALVSGFDDDAWTNRPSSAKPLTPTPAPAASASAARAPSAPPQTQASAPTLAPTPTVTASVPQSTPAAVPTATPTTQTTTPSLANTTESDIFNQLARLSNLKQNTTPQIQPQNPSPAPVTLSPPAGFRSGMGLSSSPIPMGQISLQPNLSPPPVQPYNGPRGPFAPVPANQSLLQPLIPTQTGFSGFIPTKPTISASPFGNTLAPPSFLSQPPPIFSNPQPILSQPTGFVAPQTMLSQPTGFANPQPMLSQPTGMFNGNLNTAASPFGSGTFGAPLQSQMTGFNPPPPNHSNFNTFAALSSPPPPLPTSQNNNNTSPANVFAQMKSGTFANDDNTSHGTNTGLNGQTPAWGQSYQGYTGY